MINRLIDGSLRNRFLVACATLFIVAWGWRAVMRTPVDAIPDLSENQVIVFADWMGRSPQEVEDQVTYPLSVNLQGLAGVKTVRATSMFGFSLITVIFEDRIDNYFARSRVLERLNYLGDILPSGVVPKLGPDATGLGWVYQYYMEVDPTRSPRGGYDLGQLRSLQDWFIRYQLNSVQGVAEVGSIGGFVRQYQIEVSSSKLRAARVPLDMVMSAVSGGNLNVGGKVIEENGMEFVVRGVGLIQSIADLENIVLMQREGTPVYLRDVATVQLGGDFRRGTLDVDGREVVGGTVVMRTGENAMEVIRRVKARIAEISPSLPPGVSVRPFYDRSELIDRTIGTLRHALVEEMILVTLAHIIFLFHFRSILIVTLPLPLSILVSFILMHQFGISSNIMSLSGIAIAIGVLVDAGIVMTENVLRHCEQAEHAKRKRLHPGGGGAGESVRLSAAETWEVVREASFQVGRPIFFAMVIIILAFIPVFSLTGQEGKLFHPLAFTKTFAMVGSTFLAVTVVPVLCGLLVRGPFHGEDRNWVMRFLLAIYNPVLDWALAWRKTVLASAATLLGLALILAFGLPDPVRVAIAKVTMSADHQAADNEHLLADFASSHPRLAQAITGMGSEFMPPLNEGSLLFMPVLLPSTSLTEVKRIMSWQDRVIRSVPEVASVGGKLGRAETATDPAPVEMIETTIMLKPEYLTTNRTVLGLFKVPWTVRNPEWRPDSTKASLIAELTAKLSDVPGYVPGFLQPIENRILMISTGIRAQVGIKIMGERLRAQELSTGGATDAAKDAGGHPVAKADRLKENLEELQHWAFEAEKIVRTVPGAVGVAPSRVQGKPYVEVEVDRVAMARFGLRAQDVLDVVEAGVGGRNVSTAIEGRERYPIQVRLDRSERDDIERLGELLVATPAGRFIPLGQLADIRRVLGPSEIASENGRLRVFVQANVQGRDLGGFVEDIRARLDRRLKDKLPPGITVEFSGQFEDLLRARHTLTFVFPAVLLIIFILLYVVYHSAKEAAHVILAVPFALSGGVFLQYALGYNFSVAVWVGYIALFGTAIQTGVVMVVYLEEMLRKKQEEADAAGRVLTRADLLNAIRDGARLRLRPKVMTVATIVASLLPIMWSHKTGAEVMKPLATPVIGGMISSLLHILVVTPVIFAWLRERELKQEVAKPD